MVVFLVKKLHTKGTREVIFSLEYRLLSPVLGAFMDATGSYDASFYLSGSLIFLSAVICYPLNRINVWETRRGSDKCSDDPS